MRAIVVLVEPEYEENIGLIARVTKNFGFEDLWLVNPKANHLSDKAISRAMHASELLKNARIFSSLEEALSRADFSAATTAIASRDKNIERNAITPKELAENFKGTDAKLAIVFGRESRGLTNTELAKCDFIVNIPSSREYRTLNVSHAAAIILYELFMASGSRTIAVADQKTKETVVKLFETLAKRLKNIRNKKATTASFKHLVSRAPITKREANAVIAVLSELEKELKHTSKRK
ncbi:MAG: RNA methyltransferase [Candidatus Diapherotrites archaeon]|nr:RNA methyltransferase [Candidatus Diapherotrites archaeon]